MKESPSQRQTVLIVEDEKKIAAFIKRSLESEGYEVEIASDGEKGEELLRERTYDIVILDIMLPKKDGLHVLRSLRERSAVTPVLMLTAKGAIEDRVMGLDSGADDYLVKPFAIEELLARIRSLGRRKGPEQSSVPALSIADLTLDLVTRKAVRGEKTIDLTSREFALLEFFLRNKNIVLDRATISSRIWNINFDTGTNIIDVYINHLRAKIDGGFERKLLHTIRGSGYIMREE